MRLLKNQKEVILSKMMERAFKERADELREEHSDLALSFYEDIYSASERKLLRTTTKGWFPTTSYVRIVTTGRYRDLHLDGGFREHINRLTTVISGLLGYRHRSDVDLPIPNCHTSGEMKRYTVKDELAIRLEDLDNRRDSLVEEMVRTSNEIWAVIDSVSSNKRLIEIWPEIEQYVPKDPPKGEKRAVQGRAIAPIMDGLNSILRLPPKDKERAA